MPALMRRALRHCGVLAILVAAGACAAPDGDAPEAGSSNARDVALPFRAGPPAYDGPPFRAGIALGRRTHYVPPDLSGLPALARSSQVILEVQIDASGNVVSARVLRGLRDDIDARVVEAVRQWRYEPARLRKATGQMGDAAWPAGTAVPAYFTIGPSVSHDGSP